MRELSAPTPTSRERERTDRVAALAGTQFGVVSWGQLERCGVTASTASRWIARGRLRRVHPGVYAVGHEALAVEGEVWAGYLYAGAGAALSHTTAGWWWRITDALPRRIHISAPGDRGSLRTVCVHHPRELEITVERGLRVTTIARTLLDLAAMLSFPQLRRALAEADHLRILDPGAVEAVVGRGRPGSTALRRVLTDHCPSLADTLSELEERFLSLCDAHEIPLPEVNARVCGLMVDGIWREQRLVVELDGHAAHARPAAIERDRQRELTLRAAGYPILRYTWQQVTQQAEPVAADLRAALS